MQRLLQRLVERRPVITDGAWGTELQARGLAIGEFSDLWNLSHAERVAEVAGAYIEAGSQIILTNTFGAKVRLHICGDTRHILEGMDKLRCDIVDLDSLDPLSEARRKMGDWQVPLGNMNPATILRDGGVEAVTQAVGACHRDAG